MNKPAPLPIVALGASAGGLEPLRAFARTIEPGCGMAFIVVSDLLPVGSCSRYEGPSPGDGR
jgi:chemotaxis response regulator CheB